MRRKILKVLGLVLAVVVVAAGALLAHAERGIGRDSPAPTGRLAPKSSTRCYGSEAKYLAHLEQAVQRAFEQASCCCTTPRLRAGESRRGVPGMAAASGTT